MINDDSHAAERLMSEFAARTGVSSPESPGARYLWTDAFAVFNFLALHALTGNEQYLDWARRLVNQVHHTLGRHRDDDPRTGWISGLGESAGEQHPTRGGLRIGKRLNERGPGEAYDERSEWDRDGQYFHYLTKWMHALNRMTMATGDAIYDDWALELAETAHRAFVYDSPDGRRRMHWKMSIDLSRPLVPSMGQLDALDGFVACARLMATRSAAGSPDAPDLWPARSDFHGMCEGATWTTADELGIGGLLADAAQLASLTAAGALDHSSVLTDVLEDAERSLRLFASNHQLDRTAETRLAFRELGLAIGLQAVRATRHAVMRQPDRFHDCETLLARIDAISRYSPLTDRIEHFWLDPNNQRAAPWTNHLDINAVMLVTSLVPHVCLMGGPCLDADGDLTHPTHTSTRERS